MFDYILLYSQFACGVILFFFALLQLTYKNREFINFNLSGLYLCLSYVILIFWLFKSGLILHLTWLFYTDTSMAFAIGPFVYFYLKTVAGFKTKSYYKYLIHFIPAITVYISIVIYNANNKSLTDYYINNNIDYPVYHIDAFIHVIDISSSLFMISYFIPSALILYTLLKDKKHSYLKELKIVFRYFSLIMFFSAMMLIAGIIRNDLLNLTAIYSLTILAVWYFIFSFRYPDFTQKAIREAKIIRYKKPILNSIDSDVVIDRMEELMEDDKKFLDSELTLQKLSEELMVTVHQLSKILNSKRGVNFPSFINSYRVKESKNLMKQFPEKNILEIALESGFNSKSSFNSAFSKETGLTPRDFRKGILIQE